MGVETSFGKLSGDLARKIKEISGEDILLCYQCGMCSAGCPISFAMDILPNQIIQLVQLGLEADIAKSKTIWLCASCLTCVRACPFDVPIIEESGAYINPAACYGCGACASVCPGSAISLAHFDNNEIREQVKGAIDFKEQKACKAA